MKYKVTITSWFDCEFDEVNDGVKNLEDAQELAEMLVSSGELTGGERICSNFNWNVDVDECEKEGAR